jgi:hypothetical protein
MARRIALVRIVLLVLFTLAATSAAVATDNLEDHVPIWRKLCEPSRVECKDVPLSDLKDYLSEYHLLPINVDSKALVGAGVDPKRTPFTLTLIGERLDVTLGRLLKDRKLSFMIKDGVLSITSQKAASAWQKYNYGADEQPSPAPR